MYRRYRVPSAWREMDRLQREMNRLFEGYAPSTYRRAAEFPAINMWANEDSLIITAEVPGVNPDDINVSVVGETMTLSGERNPDEVGEGTRYHRQERGYGKFNRTQKLPFPVDVKKVDATFKNGVLHIAMPRTEEDKPRKIVVKNA